MKKAKKILLLVLCAALLVSASVMGTLAYLTSTAKVTNTFTVGSVNITMDEAKVNEYGQKLNANDGVWVENEDLAARVSGSNTYKLIPGHTYVKDPTIHVAQGSEACYVFVKVTNQVGTTIIDVDSLLRANNWVHLEGNIWYQVDAVDARATAKDVVVFKEFTIDPNATAATLASVPGSLIEVTAYAIQADGFTSATAAWAAAGSSFNNP